jgi:hypothetical protein
MWHEAALPGMGHPLDLKVDTPASLRRSGRPIFGRVRRCARKWTINGELGLDELRGALAQALASTGPAGFR